VSEFFIQLLFGHLVGDYLLQNKWMALNKSASSLKCLVHCLIYTAAVSLFTWPSVHGACWSLFLLLSHYPIDRYNIADKWLQLINGRSLTDFIKNGTQNIPDDMPFFAYLSLRGGFTALVYAVVDNTLHLLIMYYGYKYGCNVWR